jgi:hypothetical protein
MIRCAVCDRIKEEGSGGWWALWLSRVMPADNPCLSIAPLEICTDVEASAYKPACGNNCAQKLVERWLDRESMQAAKAMGESV